jgi:quercetin dioxygenase-like cupin family protein
MAFSWGNYMINLALLMKVRQKAKVLHKDSRGKILQLAEDKVTSVLLILSKRGAVRANHYHKFDSHYVYMLSGRMRYSYKRVGKKPTRKRSVILKKGDLVYTPPKVVHAMEFLEDSEFLAMTAKKRQKKLYENDTVRVKLV